MLIHSITPRPFLEENPPLPTYTTRPAPFGYVTGYNTPDGFCVSRIHSTNPADYLNEGNAPGSILRGQSSRDNG